MTEALPRYHELLARVDILFAEIRARQGDAITCRLGCHSCCKPNLTVGAVEAESIYRGLLEDPDRVEKLRALAAADPFEGLRCSFLAESGACGIYELRPLVCRTHGLPLEFKDFAGEAEEEEAVFRDACPLNFTGQDLASLPNQDVLNLDTLNTILSVLNRMVDSEGARIPLELDALLNSRERANSI